PTCLLTSIEIFSSIAPMSLLSIWSHSFSITRKPVASEVPKSPSPARPSRLEKYCSLRSTVWQVVRIACSIWPCVISVIVFPPSGRRCGQLAEVGERDVDVGFVAQFGDDLYRAGKILVHRVGAGGDQRRQPGSGRGEQAVAAVLDHHALVRLGPALADVERHPRHHVDFRIGLLGRDA